MQIQIYADDIFLHFDLCSQNWSMTNARILPVRIDGKRGFISVDSKTKACTSKDIFLLSIFVHPEEEHDKCSDFACTD